MKVKGRGEGIRKGNGSERGGNGEIRRGKR